MDADVAGNRGRAAERCRSRQRQHDRADAQKNTLKPHLQKQWVIPPEANAAFVASMEDVLEVYQRRHDPDRPIVCLDETTKQLISETRVPVPAQPGQPPATTTSTSAMVPPICFCCSPHWRDGGMSKRPTDTPRSITRRSSRRCPTDTSPARARWCWCRTISARTSQLHSTKPSPPPRHAVSSNGSNGITHPSTAVGWTWPKRNLRPVTPVPRSADPQQAGADRGNLRLGARPQ